MPSNPDSILDSVKKAIGLDFTDTTFDLDVTMFINSAFGSLKQLGVGGDKGFLISDNTTLWSQYLTSLEILSMVKTFVTMSVRLLFDPPDSRFALPAMQKVIEELTWRINVEAEQANGEVVKAYFAPTVVNLAFSSSVTPDASAGNVFYLSLTADCSINAPVNGADGEHITLELTSNGHAVTWGNGWDFGDAGAPSLSGGGKADVISAYYKQIVSAWRAGFVTGF